MMPLVESTVADLLARTGGRRAGIVFCVNVAHAEAVLAALRTRGERAALVHGGTAKGERAELIGQFQAGALRWMVNVNVLSEGFDAPHIDCVAMLRPTKSPGLYYQQVGRGFRLAPGKADCLVLDYAGNMLEHGPVDAIRVRPSRAKGAAKVETTRAKECPKCSALLPIGVRVCECGYSFASTDPAHLDRPVDAPVLSTDRPRVVHVHPVHSVKYSRHKGKNGKPDSLRVTYQCGLRQFSEWICLQHGGMARTKALQWWVARAGAGQVPRTVEEALPLAWQLPTPTAITVDETDKFPEIKSYEWPERGEEGAADCSRGADADAPAPAARPDAVQRVRGVPGWLVRAVEGRRAA